MFIDERCQFGDVEGLKSWAPGAGPDAILVDLIHFLFEYHLIKPVLVS